MATKKMVADPEIHISEISQKKATFCVLGSSPLIMERMSEKAKGELLLPKGKKTTAEKAVSLKHNPIQEYRDSAYLNTDDRADTRLMLRSGCFKGTIRNAALDLPGAKKAQIGRLTYIPGEYVPIFGEPRLFMTIVRSSDMNRTPDVRTRLIVPEWAAFVTVAFIYPQLREQGIANLLAAAGAYIGVGGWRPEKGSGSYGQFTIVNDSDPVFQKRLQIGREQQDKLIENPVAYDKETEDLLAWYGTETVKRGIKVV